MKLAEHAVLSFGRELLGVECRVDREGEGRVAEGAARSRLADGTARPSNEAVPVEVLSGDPLRQVDGALEHLTSGHLCIGGSVDQWIGG